MSSVWLIILGAMAIIIGATGGAVRLGGFRSGRSWNIQSAFSRAAITLLGLVLVFVGVGQLLGYSDRLGIAAATRVVAGPAGVDLLLIAVGLLFLLSGIFVKSYIRAEDDATGVLKKIPGHRVVGYARVLTFGISVVFLVSGIWGLANILSR